MQDGIEKIKNLWENWFSFRNKNGTIEKKNETKVKFETSSKSCRVFLLHAGKSSIQIVGLGLE